MTKTTRRSPELHSIDVHIGMRLRMRRQILALSQTDLAARMNVSYQQVQKYETGANRISASRLYQTGQALGVPVEYFFDGADALASKTATRGGPGKNGKLDTSAIKALAALSRISSQGVRKSFVQLARAISRSAEVDNDDD